ncbi:MAG: hypothetical protein Q4E54_05800 [Lachnospiraceae bacterium]|nr:hypothetical protein [Lachnospiraceae bacterium]
MNDCKITTYTGLRFNPLEATADDIRIEDIAHALPLICRGNGQVVTFFSVGQHCINCAREAEARGYSRRVQMACLVHDASECYLSDVPSPLKQVMPDYRRYESRLLDIIYEKFLGSPITRDEKALVDLVDEAMLYWDLHTLLQWNERPSVQVSIGLNYDVRPFDEVEREYLELFMKLSG